MGGLSDKNTGKTLLRSKDVRIRFLDGTVIRIGYPKNNLAVWWIEVEKQGSANQKLTICEDEEADIYSDIFEIDSEIKSHSVIKQLKDEKNHFADVDKMVDKDSELCFYCHETTEVCLNDACEGFGDVCPCEYPRKECMGFKEREQE